MASSSSLSSSSLATVGSRNQPALSRWTLAVVAGGASLATVAASLALLRVLRLHVVPRGVPAAVASARRGATDGGATGTGAAGAQPPPQLVSPHCGGFMEAVGNTKLIELPSLSRITGCRVLAKCEFLNPGGSSKDRIAKAILLDAIKAGRLRPADAAVEVGRSTGGGGGGGDGGGGGGGGDTVAVTSTVVEGTSGSTGISLALASRALGLQCLVIMPDDISTDKSDLLQRFGAEVRRVPAASDSSPEHYVNRARAIAAAMSPPAFFADQFEHPANHACHYDGTGAEVWAQTGGKVDAFISGSGTGGTIAGVGRYLRERRPGVWICLADPQGSGLANRVNHKVLFTKEMRESRLRRHRYDTIVEGVGLCRQTQNFAEALDEETCGVDRGYTISDQEAITMSRWLLDREGLFLGSSSALNCCAALRVARELGPGKTIVLLLCDGGQRHVTKFWNDEKLRGMGFDPSVPASAALLVAAAAERTVDDCGGLNQ